MGTTLYGIPNCDSVKKARSWFAESGVEVSFVDIKKAGVANDRIGGWLAAVGWERLLNRRGTTWRRLDDATRAAVVDMSSARALMLSQPTLIKRPVIEWSSGTTTVGFDPGTWPTR